MILVRMLVAVLVFGASAAANGESYPEKPVRMVVPYSPGGTTDLLARLLARELSEKWGQSVVVDNRAGAGGTIGTNLVTKATPDGYTLLLAAPAPISINISLFKELPYDPVADLAPITLIATTPSLLLVNPKVPAKTVQELVALAKSSSGKLNYASTGNGSPSHLMGVLFTRAIDAKIVHIPYKGTGPALIDLLAGRVEMMFNTIPGVLRHVEGGKLRALAITGPNRFQRLPTVPTMQEVGLASVVSAGWYGLLAPAGTPASLVKKLNADVSGILSAPEISRKLTGEGANVVGNKPAEFGEFIRTDIDRWRKVISAAEIKPQ